MVTTNPPPTYREALDRILGSAVLVHGAETLADLFELDFRTLVMESGLGEIADEIRFVDAARTLPAGVRIGARFAALMERMDARSQTIALQRTYARTPDKLAQLGKQFGVSRERARQLEVRLRDAVAGALGRALESAAGWLTRITGPAASSRRFGAAMELLVGDAPARWRRAAEVVVMREAGYERLDGVVGGAAYVEMVKSARGHARRIASPVGVVCETELREALGAQEVPEWESLLRNAGLKRVEDAVVVRDTRRARVYLALTRMDAPQRRAALARAAGLKDTSSLASLLSTDPLFVRFTKDKWGLAEWTEEPYEGVVEALVRRIRASGGVAELEDLVEDLPRRFEVLPATVRNYLSTRKFSVKGGKVRIVDDPVAPPQPLESARDVTWDREGRPALQFVVGEHHLRGNSQKISIAVAQHLGVNLDRAVKVPFARPAGVDHASVIWRSYDPNGPEMGRLREALTRCGAHPGDTVHIVLDPAGLTMIAGAEGFGEAAAGE